MLFGDYSLPEFELLKNIDWVMTRRLMAPIRACVMTPYLQRRTRRPGLFTIVDSLALLSGKD